MLDLQSADQFITGEFAAIKNPFHPDAEEEKDKDPIPVPPGEEPPEPIQDPIDENKAPIDEGRKGPKMIVRSSRPSLI